MNDQRTTTRELQATIIPSGESCTIPSDTTLTITHRLGGNFTAIWDYGMIRINGTDADAIGEETPEGATPDAKDDDHEGPPDQAEIWEKLKSVYDPEIPVNIVDLGLVYSMEVVDIEDDKYKVEVKMTLTAPGCGMGPAIAEDARHRMMAVPGVNDAHVDIVWEPAWNQEMISEEGKMILGLV